MQRKNNFQITNHTLDILRAAAPYVSPTAQNSMNVLLKATELMESVRDIREPDLSACDLNPEPIDPEVILTNIRPVCYKPEVELVDMILNFMKARKIYHAYQSYNSEMVQATQVNETHSNNQTTKSSSMDNGLKDFLLSQLSPEQRSTFEAFQMVMNSMPQHTN